jgi:hypothetical protein
VKRKYQQVKTPKNYLNKNGAPIALLNFSHPDFNRRFRNFTQSTGQWL